MLIRKEHPEDFEAVRRVVEVAFGRADEALLVGAIRASEHYVPAYALVADDSGRIVGHVMLSRVMLRAGDRAETVLALAPVSVAPDRQGQGIGSALVRDVITRADAAGEALVVVLGHPSYYPRFGFTPARAMGINPPTPSFPDDAFMALRLSRDCGLRGTVEYPLAFNIQS